MHERVAKSIRANDAANTKHQTLHLAQISKPYFPTNTSEGFTLFRKSSCSCGGGCPRCAGESRHSNVQTKLTVSTPGDQYEQEADRVAEQVMRMPAPTLQRQCAGCSIDGVTCEGCETEKQGVVRRKPESASERSNSVPNNLIQDLGSGQSLDAATRAFAERRFGRDFRDVRVHADARATESAQSVNALAYTVGRDIVFQASQYAPHTSAGQRLIAHELAHVIQQGGGHSTPQLQLEVSLRSDASAREADAMLSGRSPLRLASIPSMLQRTCGTALGAPSPECAPSSAPLIGNQFSFSVNCDDLKTGEAKNLSKFATGLKSGAELKVHGFASIDGAAALNLKLSCHRANKIAETLRTARPDCKVSGVFKHGAQIGKGEPADFWRSVIVEEVKAPPKPKHVCGPDITRWFIVQVALAKINAKVLDIKSDLTFARGSALLLGMSSQSIFEGAALEKVLDAEVKAGSPKRSADASALISATTPGLTDFATAKTRAIKGVAGTLVGMPSLDLIAIEVLSSLRSAALKWKALVGHGMDYDFKADAKTMSSPKSDNCPVDCLNSVTFCPGATGSNCFGQDMPGNLFYATIGHFVGFSENALQLGSQFAQLTSPKGKKTWDPPEDTQMIRFGFGLSNPLTQTDLCTDLKAAKGSFVTPVCADCLEPTTASFKHP